MSFANPEFSVLFFIIAFLHYWATKKKKHQFFLDHSDVDGISNISQTGKWIKLAHLMRYVCLLLMIIALMRPREGQEQQRVPESGIDIVLAVDTSGSMKALDFKKGNERVNRLSIVKDVLKDFVIKRKGDRISLVTFGETAFTLSPLTSDVDSLLSIVKELEIGMAGESTAIGSAMGVAINRLKNLEAKSKIVILLTDGRNNAGKVGPVEMSDVAKEMGVKFYTVGIGTVGGQAPFEVDSFFGKRMIYQNVDLDVETLTKVATTTGGKFFNATNTQELESIYSIIDDLEKREIKVQTFTNYKDHYFYFLFFAMVILALDIFVRTFKLKSFP